MAPPSSTLAWKIPWMKEPGGLQSMGSLSRTRLSDFTFTFHFHALEKEMATHSSVLAWRIPGMGEPGGLPSMGLHSRTRLKWLSSSSSKATVQKSEYVCKWLDKLILTKRKDIFAGFFWSVCFSSHSSVLNRALRTYSVTDPKGDWHMAPAVRKCANKDVIITCCPIYAYITRTYVLV